MLEARFSCIIETTKNKKPVFPLLWRWQRVKDQDITLDYATGLRK